MMLLGGNPDLCVVDATDSSTGPLATILRLFGLQTNDGAAGQKISPGSGCSLCSGQEQGKDATTTRFDSSDVRCTLNSRCFSRIRRKKRNRSPTIINNVPAISSNSQSTLAESESSNSIGLNNLENIVHCALITLATVVVYGNAIHGDFVHDDVAAIVTNKDALGKTSMHSLLHNDFWGMDIKDRYQCF